MTDDEALNQVAMLNEIFSKKPWLDIDVVECSPHAVVLDCGIDLTVGPDIEVRFESVFLVFLLMAWKTDTSFPVLRLLGGEEGYKLNAQYQVEIGHHLFSFQPEYLAEGVRCLIAAKSMSWRHVIRD